MGFRRVRLVVAAAAAASVVCVAPTAAVAASWSVQTAPAPAGASSAVFYGVSCPSPSSCTAVGVSDNRSPFAAGWNGTSWTLESTPAPAGASETALVGVSCAAPAACMAVGWSDDANFVPTLLAEHWDGAKWSTASPLVPPSSTQSSFDGISCATATDCIAVGNYWAGNFTAEFPLAEHWDGSNWTLEQVPSTETSELYAVSCSSTIVCTAVGGGDTGYRRDAGVWAQQPGPPSGQGANGLFGVSCSSASACTAVGYALDFTNGVDVSRPIAERWDGISWTTQQAAGGENDQRLLSVSCPTSGSCTAVGDTMVQRWQGGTWTSQAVPTPNPPPTFYGVSCPKQNVCTAVGSDSSGPVAERYS